jgi:hypothetical protein
MKNLRAGVAASPLSSRPRSSASGGCPPHEGCRFVPTETCYASDVADGASAASDSRDVEYNANASECGTTR